MRHLIATPAITALLIGTAATAITVGAPGTAVAATAATAATGDRAHHAPLPPSSHRKGKKAVRRGKKRKQPQSSFVLMRSESGTDRRRDTDQSTLHCEPAGGDHPKAADACRDLLASKGGFQLPAGDSVCPMMHAPVTVQAIGLWRGTVKRFSATYGNECLMRSRTGAIFGF